MTLRVQSAAQSTGAMTMFPSTNRAIEAGPLTVLSSGTRIMLLSPAGLHVAGIIVCWLLHIIGSMTTELAMSESMLAHSVCWPLISLMLTGARIVIMVTSAGISDMLAEQVVIVALPLAADDCMGTDIGHIMFWLFM